MLEETYPEDFPETQEGSLPEQLIYQAQTQGYLLLDDLLAAMPELEENMGQLEELFIYCVNQGPEIYSDSEDAEAENRPYATRET
jgi:hypothetical protein